MQVYSETKLTFRRFRDGDHQHRPWQEEIFTADRSHKCPTYVHRTPPCQGSCPAGEDIRGWLNIVRGIEQPPEGMNWQEYAFHRLTDSNPMPAIMGRVCPAPCEDGCNRNEVEDHVGINAVEQYIGDYALEHGLNLRDPGADTGKKVACIGGGPAGLTAAYQLRRMGHAVTIFDSHEELGGMIRYGIPGYRTPRHVLDGEIARILDMGVETRMKTRVGADVSIDDLREEFDAIFVAVGAQSGRALPVPGGDAPNCVSGVAFLRAFNEGRLQHTACKVLVVGGGDTSMDVAAVARRLGHITHTHRKDHPEVAVLGYTAHDAALAAQRQGAEVVLISREAIADMPAAQAEIQHVTHEGVSIRGSLLPVAVVLGEDGRATALRVKEVESNGTDMALKEGTEFEIECDLIVSAIGQGGDLAGLEQFDNGRGLISADGFYRVAGQEDVFVGGDIVKPHLLTTAIGHGSIAAEGIDHVLSGKEPAKRPKVDKHHYDLLEKLREVHLEPAEYPHIQERGTCDAEYAVHNYEDRSHVELVPADELFLGHWSYLERHKRAEQQIGPDQVLGHFEERIRGLSEDEAKAEADRCMSCGMCVECDNCVIFCPQDAIQRVPKDRRTMGRYVETHYEKCVGCHICEDVCPSGYIQMGLGE